MEEPTVQNNQPSSQTRIYLGVFGVIVASIAVLSLMPGSLDMFRTLYEQQHTKTTFGGSLPEFVDRDTFVLLNTSQQWINILNTEGASYDAGKIYAKDKNAAYVYVNMAADSDNHANYQLKKINGADPTTFAVVKVNPDYSMALFPSTVPDYCNDVSDGQTGRTIPHDECKAQEDKRMIEFYASSTVEEGYAKDKDHVYWGTDIVQGADLASFGSLYTYGGCCSSSVWNSLARDSAHLFFKGKIIEGVHIASFHIVHETDKYEINNSDYAKDDARVYFWSGTLPLKIVSNADPVTFKLLPGGYATDYSDTFTTFYAEDKSNIYFNGEIVNGADKPTFIVFYEQQPLAKTCNLPQGCSRDAKDKNHSYYKGEVVQ